MQNAVISILPILNGTTPVPGDLTVNGDLGVNGSTAVQDLNVGTTLIVGSTSTFQDNAVFASDVAAAGAVTGGINPLTAAFAAQTGFIYMGSGVPSNTNGNNGDFYFRTDTPATATQRLYVKSAGAWVATLL